MNILIVCGEYFNQSNGLSLSTQRFVEQFKRLGDEVRVLSSDRGGKSEYPGAAGRLHGVLEAPARSLSFPRYPGFTSGRYRSQAFRSPSR